MFDTVLTKASKKLICILYKEYLEKCESGMSKDEANYFQNSQSIQEDLIPEWSFEDVENTCRELKRAGFITCSYYENMTYFIKISDSAIIYMENRFKKGLLDVTKFLTGFI